MTTRVSAQPDKKTMQAVQSALAASGVAAMPGRQYGLGSIRHGGREFTPNSDVPAVEFWSEAQRLTIFMSNGSVVQFVNHHFQTQSAETVAELRADISYGGKKGDPDFERKLNNCFWEGDMPAVIKKKLDDFRKNLTRERGHHEAIREDEDG